MGDARGMTPEDDIGAPGAVSGLDPVQPLLAEVGVRQSQKEATRNRVILAAR